MSPNDPEWTTVASGHWTDEEDLDGFLGREPALPWSRGGHGKFLVTPEGKFHSWATDSRGIPHHDSYADENGLGQVIKGDIAPSGAWWPTDQIHPDTDQSAWVDQVAPQAQRAGLRPALMTYAAGVRDEVCPLCKNYTADCTCPPAGGSSWATDPVADPFRDLDS